MPKTPNTEDGPKGHPKDDRFLTETANAEQAPAEDKTPPAPKPQPPAAPRK